MEILLDFICATDSVGHLVVGAGGVGVITGDRAEWITNDLIFSDGNQLAGGWELRREQVASDRDRYNCCVRLAGRTTISGKDTNLQKVENIY